jgi:hypothetical protein
MEMSKTRSQSNLKSGLSEIKHQIHHQLIQISQEIEQHAAVDLDRFHTQLKALYNDLYLLRAIRQAQQTLKPGDLLTYEEAIDFLEDRSLPFSKIDNGKTLEPKNSIPETIDIRYCRSFLQDLCHLDVISYQQIYQFTFTDLGKMGKLRKLPEFRALGADTTLYSFTCENHQIGIEVIGRIIKFIRILKPQ